MSRTVEHVDESAAMATGVRLTRGDECTQRPDGRWSCWPAEAPGAASGPEAGTDRDLEVFRIAAEHFRHDLTALWDHSNFFLIIHGALFTVLAAIVGPRDPSATGGLASVELSALFIAFMGLAVGVFWSVAAWRRLKLIQLWRENVMHLDGRVDRHGLYLRVEPAVGARWWYGPSALTARLPWLISSAWFLVVIWLVVVSASGA